MDRDNRVPVGDISPSSRSLWWANSTPLLRHGLHSLSIVRGRGPKVPTSRLWGWNTPWSGQDTTSDRIRGLLNWYPLGWTRAHVHAPWSLRGSGPWSSATKGVSDWWSVSGPNKLFSLRPGYAVRLLSCRMKRPRTPGRRLNAGRRSLHIACAHCCTPWYCVFRHIFRQGTGNY